MEPVIRLARFRDGGRTFGLTGHLTYEDRSGKTKIVSQSITSLTISGTRATCTGTCTVDKASGFNFTADVFDNGTGSTDFFQIQVSNGYQASGTLGGGNIQIRK